MNFLKIARDILAAKSRRAAETGAPSEVKVMAVLADGSGEAVEYEVECSVETFDVQKVTRVDTAQEVDAEAFKVIFGKAALEKLAEEAAELAGSIEEARGEEELGAEPAPEPADAGTHPAPAGPPDMDDLG